MELLERSHLGLPFTSAKKQWLGTKWPSHPVRNPGHLKVNALETEELLGTGDWVNSIIRHYPQEPSTDIHAVFRELVDEWRATVVFGPEEERSPYGYPWVDSIIRHYPQEPSTDIHAVFRELVDEWKRATEFISITEEMVLHPSYQRIIGLGPSVIPFLLQELERDPDHWFWALQSITRVNPALGADTFDGAVSAWLDWGAQRGYLRRDER